MNLGVGASFWSGWSLEFHLCTRKHYKSSVLGDVVSINFVRIRMISPVLRAARSIRMLFLKDISLRK